MEHIRVYFPKYFSYWFTRNNQKESILNDFDKNEKKT